MPNKYKVKIKMEGDQDPVKFTYYEDGHIESSGDLHIKKPLGLLGDIGRLCNWLKSNGGTKLEVTEEET